MKYAARIVMIFALWSWVLVPPRASAGPGGHGGGGGHSSGGHVSSHSSRGPSSGSTSAHSGGDHSTAHSIAHLFGRHSKGAYTSQFSTADTTLVKGEMVPETNPRMVLRHKVHPLHRRPHNGQFGVGECPTFEFPANRLFWRDGFNCFNGGFFFADPFLSLAGWDDSPIGPMEESPDQSGSDDMSSINFNPGNDAGDQAEREPRVTLLQLREGSIYGLIEYWVEGDELHYVTNYGGQNSVPIQRIDFEKTAKLNADRGVEFVLRPKPVRR
jgi:hypothetical protein